MSLLERLLVELDFAHSWLTEAIRGYVRLRGVTIMTSRRQTQEVWKWFEIGYGRGVEDTPADRLYAGWAKTKPELHSREAVGALCCAG